jgi:hypothetical protein
MSENIESKDICVCNKTQRQNKKIRNSSYVLGLFIAILPKCPFCAFGYSAVITMCSGKNLHTYSPSSLNWLPILLAFLLLISLLWNFKGQTSYYAIAIAVFGTGIIAYSELITGSEITYYIGVLILLISVLLNGRFRYLFKKINFNNNSL